MNALLLGFRKYADFSGRTTRRDFWQFVMLTHTLLFLLLLPAWLLLLQWFHDVMNDPRVLDVLVAMIQTPEEAYSLAQFELTDTLRSLWEPFVDEIAEQHLPTLICTIAALVWGGLILIPTLSMTARRLADAGHSRWWLLPPLLLLIPLPIIADAGLIGSIVTLIFCSQPSRPEVPGLPPH